MGKSLGGVVMQNGWLPACAERDLQRAPRMPFFVSEGDMDNTVDRDIKDRTARLLKRFHYPTVLVKAWFLNLADAIVIRRRVLEFLCRVLPKSGEPVHESLLDKFDEP